MKHTTHRLEKVILGKNGYTVFKCNFPDCRYYLQAKLVLGRTSICNRCQEEFILDKPAMKLVKPHCKNCVETKMKKDNKSKFDVLTQFLEDKGVV